VGLKPLDHVGQARVVGNQPAVAPGGNLSDRLAALPGVVLLRDAELAERRITGVYDLRNPEAALRAMAQP
ncbi:hypothetical protein R0G64_32555, partial [Pseudomonas otitidis]|nr:hypothetical protein [Pseudomonas otitidis]